MNKYEKLTLKEINIIFKHTYNLDKANNYIKGYLPADYEFDVLECAFEDEILIRYSDSPGGLPISAAQSRFI